MRKVFVLTNGYNELWCNTLNELFEYIKHYDVFEDFERMSLDGVTVPCVEYKYTIEARIVTESKYQEMFSREFDGF